MHARWRGSSVSVHIERGGSATGQYSICFFFSFFFSFFLPVEKLRHAHEGEGGAHTKEDAQKGV